MMQAKGYSEKDVLAADVQKAYAERIGRMGGGAAGGSGSGGIASDLIGMMAGMKMAGNLFDKMDGAMFPSAGDPPKAESGVPASGETWACTCGETANTKKFCMNCGRPKPEAKKAGTWVCPSCGAEGIIGRFCSECGTKRPEVRSLWICPNCGCKDVSSKFYPECGSKRPE